RPARVAPRAPGGPGGARRRTALDPGLLTVGCAVTLHRLSATAGALGLEVELAVVCRLAHAELPALTVADAVAARTLRIVSRAIDRGAAVVLQRDHVALPGSWSAGHALTVAGVLTANAVDAEAAGAAAIAVTHVSQRELGHRAVAGGIAQVGCAARFSCAAWGERAELLGRRATAIEAASAGDAALGVVAAGVVVGAADRAARAVVDFVHAALAIGSAAPARAGAVGGATDSLAVARQLAAAF